MDALTIWAGGVGGWVLRSSVQASILALLVLIVQGLCRKHLSPGWKHGLWLLVVGRLILPIGPQSALSLFNLVPLGGLPNGAHQNERATAPSASVRSYLVRFKDVATPTPATPLSEDPSAQEGAVQPSSEQARPGGPGSKNFVLLRDACFCAWLIGIVLQLARLGFQNLRFSIRLKRDQHAPGAELTAILERCQESMRVRWCPRLVETSAVQSPGLYGWIRPRLLLPTGMSTSFTAEELRCVFLHELAHVKRGDMVLNWIFTALQVVHWFNPILAFAFWRVRADRELATDALALTQLREGENRSYGETIIKILARLNQSAVLPGLVGILEDKRQLTHRIRMIASFRRRPSSWIAFVLCIGLALATLTDAQVDKSAAPAVVTPPLQPKTNIVSVPAVAPVPSVATLIQDGRMLLEMGRLDQAEAALDKALQQDPDSQNARYYRDLVREWKEGRTKLYASSAILTNVPNAARKRLYQKLNSIVLETVVYDNVPLWDVVADLSKQARLTDPEGRGINIILDPLVRDPSAPAQMPTPGAADLANLRIRLRLKNVLLGDAIDAVTKVAEASLQWRVLDYGVVISEQSGADLDRVERAVQILNSAPREPGRDGFDPAESSAPGLGNPNANSNKVPVLGDVPMLGRREPNVGLTSKRDVPERVANGAVATASQTPASAQSNPPGKLPPSATAQVQPPQVVVEIKFAEFSESDLKQSPFLTFLNDASPELDGPGASLQITNRNGVISPPALDEKGNLIGTIFDNPGLRNLEQVSPGRAKTITAAQFRAVLHALEQKVGADVLAAPRVTTLSGREASIQVVEMKSIVAGVTISTDRQNRSKANYQTFALPIGPTVDVLPDVTPDREIIHLTVVPTWTEFLGYDQPTPFVPDGIFQGKNLDRPLEVQRPLPHFRARQARRAADLRDGETIVITGFGKSPSPILSPAALFDGAGGRTAAADPSLKRQLVVFVTATLIDAAGNRLNPQ